MTFVNPIAESGDRRNSQPSPADRYRRDGFLVMPNVLTPDDVTALREEALAICRGIRGPIRGVEISPDEEPATDVFRRYLCVHFPHKVSALALATMSHPTVVAALEAIIGPNIKAMQSMLFIKADGKPGQAWHQDENFIPTRDRSLTAAWLALDDATIDNGCLWVLPGSHQPGVIYPDREHDDDRFDCATEAFGFPYRDEDAVPVQVSAGSVVLFNGYLLHRSMPNASAGMRRSLVTHYMSAESLLPWLEAPAGVPAVAHDHRDIVMISGVDPYAWKGTKDIVTPEVRPDRSGGCLR